MDMLIIKYYGDDNMNHELVKELTKGRVGYYWNSDDECPTLEVFIYKKSEDEIIKMRDQLRKTFNKFFEIDRLGKEYYRILLYFNYEEFNEEQLLNIISEMERLGESEYNVEYDI